MAAERVWLPLQAANISSTTVHMKEEQTDKQPPMKT